MYQGKPVPIVALTAERYGSLSPQGVVPIPTRQPQTGAPFDLLPPLSMRGVSPWIAG